MAAVVDSITAARHQAQIQQEMAWQQEADYVKAFEDTYRYINVEDVSSLDRQAGKRMVRSLFESRLQKLNPSISFYTWFPDENTSAFMNVPDGMGVRDVYRATPEGRERVSRYRDEAILNEYSIILLRDKKVAAMGADGFLEKQITDLPKIHRRRLKDGTWDVEFEGLANTEKLIKEPCGEIRGWRSVLLQLIKARVLDLGAVEREFGAGDRLTWAAKLGTHKGLISPV